MWTNSNILVRTWTQSRLNGIKLFTKCVHLQKSYDVNTANRVKFTNKIVLRNNDMKQITPLLILFGWGDGKHKQLARYSELFEKFNFTTVCVTTTLVNSILRTSTAGRRESQNVRLVIDDLMIKNPDRPIFLYAFSNSGCAIYHLLTENMTSNAIPGANIRAVIFDSCPVVPNEKSVSSVKDALLLANENKLTKIMIYIFSFALQMFVHLLLYTNKDVKMFMGKLENWNIKSPQLFIFSKTDQLAPYEDILDFIDKRKQQGVDVTYKLFEDSSHVGHMKKYRDEYTSVIEDFIKKQV